MGRFHSNDMLADTFCYQTPYAYAINNPIRFIDWMGMGPGDLFKKIDEAAIDWGMTYNGKSISDNKEYGSIIYIVKNDEGVFYTYSEANVGSSIGVNPTPSPEGSTDVARIHSHAGYDFYYDNNNFSEGDIETAEEKGTDSYVSTPNGSLQKYDVETNEISLISTEMPKDPNDPDKYPPKTKPLFNLPD